MERKRAALSQEVESVSVSVADESQNPYESPFDGESQLEQRRADPRPFLAKAVGVAVALLGICVVLAVIVPFIVGMISGLVWHLRS